MSTQICESRNDVDDEPEEGEIQDDEGSLEDVSSDDEICLSVKRKERGFYSRTSLPIRSQFAKSDAQIMQSARRSSERIETKLKKSQIRLKSGYRVMGEQDNYHENMQGHRSSKDLNQKISGKIHEKENKGKDSKKNHRSSSYHSSGSELRSAYHFSEHSESNFSSSTSSKGMWRKSDVKEKQKKKRKNNKNNKFLCPLGEVCESQQKIASDTYSLDEPSKPIVNLEGSTMSQIENKEEKEKAGLSPSSVSSDIQILDVPVILPEVITICDSDDDLMSKNGGINKSENAIVKEESNELPSTELERRLEKKDVEKNNTEDSEDHLKFLREAALKSSKPETCPNVNQDDEVLQLRLAALRSAIIRKCEERKKRGLTLSKTSRKSCNQQMMSISPLGSPNYSSSGDSSIRASGEIYPGSFSPFDFNVTDPVNDGEVDKIAAIDMELAESDEEREGLYIDVGEDLFRVSVERETESNTVNSLKVDSEPLIPPLSEINNARDNYPPVDTVVNQKCSPSSDFPAHASPGGLHQVHVPSDRASCVHIQSGTYHAGIQPIGAGHVYNQSPVAYNIHHTPSSGADSIYASYGEEHHIRVPSGETSCALTSTGYIIGDEEQSLVFEPVLSNSVSPSQHHFSFESKGKIVQNYEQNRNIIIEDKILSSEAINSNISACEQNSDPVRDNIEILDDCSSHSLQTSENSVTFNVGNEKNIHNEHGVVIYKLGQTDHCLSPENRELDLDSMIVLDEIGESSDDNLPACHHERVPYIEEFNNFSNENSQSNTGGVAGDDAIILGCSAPQTNSGMNMSSPICNSINSSENVSSDLGNSVNYDESSISFEECTDRFTYNIQSGRFEDNTSCKILDDSLKNNSAVIQNSSDVLPHESIHESIRDLNEEIPNCEHKIISATSQDSNDGSSVINIDEYTEQIPEISNQEMKVISANSQDSSGRGSYVNVNESSSSEEGPETQNSLAEKIIPKNSQNSSIKCTYVNTDESSNQESEVSSYAMKENSQDSSDGGSYVHATSQEGKISCSTQKIISEVSCNSNEKHSYVIIDESSSQEYKVTNHMKNVISLNSENSDDTFSPINITESTRMEDRSKDCSVFESNSSNLLDSQSMIKIVVERNCEAVGKSDALNNTENTKKTSTEKEIGISWNNLTNVKHNSKSILQRELLPICERSTGSSTQGTEDVEEPVHEDDKNDDFKSSMDLLLKGPTDILKYTVDDHEVEIVNDAENGVVEDQGSSSEILNRCSRVNNLNEKDLNSDSHESGTFGNESDIVAKNLLIRLQSDTYTENVLSIGSSKSDDVDRDSLVIQTPQSSCVTTVPQNSFVSSFPKHISYPSRHSTLNMPGGKNNKLRVHESKVSGRFKINVPKLVINLGEDSDSGEDIESETIISDLTSNCNEIDVSEELKGNVGSQSVSADFEKKLDLLLKRARSQQEVTGNDVNEILSQSANLSESCQKKVVKLRSLNLASASKDNHSVHNDNPAASSAHAEKMSLMVQCIRNVPGKNTNIRVQTNNKILISGNNVGVSKTSTDKTAVDFHKSIRGKVKSVSSNNQPSSSQTSGVDIGLLPSCKQKEYIRLKRQLAQLARKEQEVKIKDAKIRDTTSLSVKRNCVDEIRLLTCANRSGSALKKIAGIDSDKTLLSRKFVRRGQGLGLVPRTDLGKSRRIVATSSNALSVLRHRLAGTSNSRIGSTSVERATVTRNIFSGLSKKIVTNSSDLRKSSTGIEVSLLNVNVNNTVKQQKMDRLPKKFSTEMQKEKEVDQKVQAKECVTVSSSPIQKNESEKTVLKRKGNHSEHSEEIRQKHGSIGEFSQEQAVDDHQTLTDLPQHGVGECHLSIIKEPQKARTETNKGLAKRKRTVSDDGRSMRWKPLVPELVPTVEQMCADDSNSQNSKASGTVDRKIVEELWNSESKLISKRLQVVQDIASVQMSLLKIETTKKIRLQIMNNIQRLKEELEVAEVQLKREEDILRGLCSEVKSARESIMKKQSEQILLSVECEEIGYKVRGSAYSIPNTCTDLIRSGLAQISRTMQKLKDGKSSESDASKSCSSDTSKPCSSGTSKPCSSGTSKPCSSGTSKPCSSGTSKPGSSGTSKPGSSGTSKPCSSGTSKPCSSGTSKPGSSGTSKPRSSGKIITEDTGTRGDHSKSLKRPNEDSSKLNPSSYLSPLDALRTTTGPNTDKYAVLCPYQMMGICNDRECRYQHKL